MMHPSLSRQTRHPLTPFYTQAHPPFIATNSHAPHARGENRFQARTYTLIKKKIKFSLYIRKSRVVQLLSHIWPTASSYTGKYLRISSYIRKPFLIYDFATAPLWISLYMRKILLNFLSVYTHPRPTHVTRWGWGGGHDTAWKPCGGDIKTIVTIVSSLVLRRRRRKRVVGKKSAMVISFSFLEDISIIASCWKLFAMYSTDYNHLIT